MPNDAPAEISPEADENKPSANSRTMGWRSASKGALLEYRHYFEQVGLVLLGAGLALGTGLFVEWRIDRDYEASFRERLIIDCPT